MENELQEKMLEFFTGLKRNERKVKQRAIKLPMKLMYALECGKFEEIMSWSVDGSSFAIKDKTGFEEKVLPALFKPSKFESFIRKLCRWGFAKRRIADLFGDKDSQSPSVWFYHPSFQRGNFELCQRVDCRLDSKHGSKSIASVRSSGGTCSIGSHVDVGFVPRNIGSSSFQSQNSPLGSQATSINNLNQQRFVPSLEQPSAIPIPALHALESLAAATGIQGQWLSHSNAATGPQYHEHEKIAAPMHSLGEHNSDLIQHHRFLEGGNHNRNSTNATTGFGDRTQYMLNQEVPDNMSSEQLQTDCLNLSQLYGGVNKLSKTQQQTDSNMSYVASAGPTTGSSDDGFGQQNAPHSKTMPWNPNLQKNLFAGLNGINSQQQQQQHNAPLSKTMPWNPIPQKNLLAGLNGINSQQQQQQQQQQVPSMKNVNSPAIAMEGNNLGIGINGTDNAPSVTSNQQHNHRQEIAQLVSDIANLTQMCEMLRQNQASSQLVQDAVSLQRTVTSQQNVKAPDESQHQLERFFN